MTRPRIILGSLVAVAMAVLLAACSSPPPMGNLLVTVTGLPSGVAGSVMVTGTSGYSRTVTNTTTLSVPAGTYAVSASEVRGNDTIAPLAYDGSASPASVTVVAAGSASTTVSYAPRSGSGHLWIPQWSGSNLAVGYARGQLSASGSPSPSVSLAGTTNGGEAIAFDGDGNMWVVDLGGYLYRYDAASLASSGTPTPSVTIDATAYKRLLGLAFDTSGNLWVACLDNDQLIAYSPDQLTADGAPTPAVVISDNGGSLIWPMGIAFDADGNLWVSNLHGDSVVQFSPTNLAATGSPVPTATISTDGAGGLMEPQALAFDANGNLWVANFTSTVVRFDSSQLTSSGNPTPAATIASSSLGTSLTGLAFDASGALWVGANIDHVGSSELRRFTDPGAFSGGVTPTADVVITSIGTADGMLMAFSPPPAGLPINAP